MAETPISLKLLKLRSKFDKRSQKSGIGANGLLRLAVHELLLKYKTPEDTIAAVVRMRTPAVK